MHASMPVQLEEGSDVQPRGTSQVQAERKDRKRTSSDGEKHKKHRSKHSHKEKDRHEDRKKEKSKRERKDHAKEKRKPSPKTGGLESGELDAPEPPGVEVSTGRETEPASAAAPSKEEPSNQEKPKSSRASQPVHRSRSKDRPSSDAAARSKGASATPREGRSKDSVRDPVPGRSENRSAHKGDADLRGSITDRDNASRATGRDNGDREPQHDRDRGMRAGTSSAARGTRGYSDSGNGRERDARRDWGRDRGWDAERGDRDHMGSRDGERGVHRDREGRDRGRDQYDSRGRGYGSGYDARDSRRGGEQGRGGQYGDQRGAGGGQYEGGSRQRGAVESGVGGMRGKRARSRSKSPRSKSVRAKAEHQKEEEKNVVAAFEDLITEEEREAKELEERRLKRAAIQAKLAAEQAKKSTAPPGKKQNGESAANGASTDAPGQGATHTSSNGAAASPSDGPQTHAGPSQQDQQPAAADRSDGEDAVIIDSDGEGQQAEDLFREPSQQNLPGGAKPIDRKNEAEEDDDDDGDLFASDDEADHGAGAKVDGAAEAPANDDRRDARQAEHFRKATTGLNDMYDDSQGYYNFRVGELMNSRYEVVKASGKGVFSSVVTSTDKLRQDADGNNPLVAIKVIRANDTMYKAGQLELKILNSLAEADPENRRHVIRLLRSFEYRNHLCLVFEHMEMNLRELTRKVGVGRGIRIDAVGQLALQMLVSLKHLRATNVLHADIKPDNILINSRMNKIKLCDLGSAAFADSPNDPTPYLVSRFYRAPEVILGLPHEFPMDMWSIACTIYELFTAEILFKGRNNNEMLKLIMDLKGPIPKRMIKKGMFSFQHFAGDAHLSFISMETDVVTKEPVKRLVNNSVKKKSLLQLLMRVTAKEFGGNIPKDELRKVENLATFLDKATALEPASRLTPEDAMQMKFIVNVKHSMVSQSTSKVAGKKVKK